MSIVNSADQRWTAAADETVVGELSKLELSISTYFTLMETDGFEATSEASSHRSVA